MTGRVRSFLAALALGAVLPGCTSVAGSASPGAAPSEPADPAALEALLLTTVPSGLPRLPDDDLQPPAGEKGIDDVAAYSSDPQREREVLTDYGYRFGWERYWGDGHGLQTSVYVHQFAGRSGATAFTEDLARNEGGVYPGQLIRDAPSLPGGCWLLEADRPAATGAAAQSAGPTALAWCSHGPFTVAVAAVARTAQAASDEVHAVVTAQLDRLPPD
jgi:hypothetical protein